METQTSSQENFRYHVRHKQQWKSFEGRYLHFQGLSLEFWKWHDEYWFTLIFPVAEELKEAKSNSNEDEEEEQENDEDAIREAVKAQKNSKKEGDEDEDEEEEEEEDSGSGSGRSASTIPEKPNRRSPHKLWEF